MIGVIGGSGFYSFFGSDARSVNLDTPYGEPSAPITVGRVGVHEVAFLPRHGLSHEFSPHTVPYRANMWALRALGVRRVFGPCAVGSLTPQYGPGTIVVPDQLVDRTRGRGDTYFDSGGIHVGFADPYCPTLRAAAADLPGVVDGGTMVVVQGPRFSTRAESNWFAREGFTLINMTGYPEAVLARELEMCYAPICYVTNYAEGVRPREPRPGELFEGLLAQAERETVDEAVSRFLDIAASVARLLSDDRGCTCGRAMGRYRGEERVGEDWHTWLGEV